MKAALSKLCTNGQGCGPLQMVFRKPWEELAQPGGRNVPTPVGDPAGLLGGGPARQPSYYQSLDISNLRCVSRHM
jgi:hypothetical protein